MYLRPSSIIQSVHISLLLLVSLFLLAACSSPKSIEPPAQPSEIPASATSPFTLKVMEDWNNGKTLIARMELTTRRAWRIDQIALRISGLNAGNIVVSNNISLKEILSQQEQRDLVKTGQLLPDTPITFLVEIESAKITDYQVELLWGQEANHLLNNHKTPPKTQLELREMRIEQHKGNCSKPPCSSKFVFFAKLINLSAHEISEAKLGVGFVWVENSTRLDLSSIIPENEEQITLGKLGLAPGASRPIKLAIDREVPERDGGTYKLLVRIIN